MMSSMLLLQWPRNPKNDSNLFLLIQSNCHQMIDKSSATHQSQERNSCLVNITEGLVNLESVEELIVGWMFSFSSNLLSIFVEISAMLVPTTLTVTSLRVEVSCLRVADDRWERFFLRRFLFALECSIVDKRFMSLGIEEYEKRGDPGGTSWQKLDACRRTCHHYSVPIHHIHARAGRILAILVNELTVDINCSDAEGVLRWWPESPWCIYSCPW